MISDVTDKLNSESKGKFDKLMFLYKKNNGGVPINLGILLKALERLLELPIETRYSDINMERDGLVWPKGDGFEILINPYRKRQRETILHEIGHILIDYKIYDSGIIRYNRPPHFEYMERELLCDKIAYYILCPPSEIISFLENCFPCLPVQLELFRRKQRPVTISRLEEMAHVFGISIKGLCEHLKGLFEIPNNSMLLEGLKIRNN